MRIYNDSERGGIDLLGIIVLGFLALQLYLFCGFIGISLGAWL
jgi:hypothetical protein